MVEATAQPEQASKSDPWSDLALTLPLFVVYHLGVVFLPVRNAADVVTLELVKLADNDLLKYGGLTLAIGVVFVTILAVLGRRRELRWQRFVWAAAEAVLYAVAMRLAAGYVVGKLPLAPAELATVTSDAPGPFAGIVLAVGAGFYEEIAFRVVLFSLGAKVIRLFAEPIPLASARLITFGWSFVAAGAFSGWHYIGALGDPFDLKSFVFRWVCGLAFTLIYAFRGFGPAVWTHAIYDIWVLVL